MINFVNAKINIGLRIVGRRSDGYHNLETLFYPVGMKAGLPENPTPFCDILEVIPRAEKGFTLHLGGRRVDCAPEKNLVHRAAELYFRELGSGDFGADIYLEKHLPDGAGCGGGSADASFTLRMLSALYRETSAGELAALALRLGADCPFFIYNRPMYAAGVGELLEDVPGLDLADYWLVLVKPKVSVSTREAFAGVKAAPADFDLRRLPEYPIEEWRRLAVNDFENSIFPQYPLLGAVKERLYGAGALYASMTGSGSSLYGIFADKAMAADADREFAASPTIEASYLLSL